MKTERSPEAPGAERVHRPAIGALLGKTHLAINRHITARLRELGHPEVRMSFATVFRGIDRAGTRISVLARRAGLSKQTMGETIRHLEEQGYVVSRPDSSDGRARIVSLTPAGRKLADLILRCGREVERQLEKRVGPYKMNLLHRTVEEFLEELGSPYRTDWFVEDR